MTRKQVVELMESSKTKDEWNANCNKVKKACDGYPEFWHSAVVTSGLADRVTGRFGQTAEIKISTTAYKPLMNIHGRPTAMPLTNGGERVVCIYNQGLGEEMIVCSSLQQMQSLYDSYAQGMALSIKWCIEAHSESSLSAH